MSPPSKHTRSKNDVEESPSASILLSVTSLPQDTPAWGVSLFTMLSNSITSLDNTISNLTQTIKNSTDTANTALGIAEQLQP